MLDFAAVLRTVERDKDNFLGGVISPHSDRMPYSSLSERVATRRFNHGFRF